MRKTKNTNGDFIKLAHDSSFSEHNEIKFTDLSGYTSLVDWINKNGFPKDGIEVFCERTRRQSLISGFVVAKEFKNKEVIDNFYIRRYGDCQIHITDDNGISLGFWPFTMLYIKTNKK